MTDRKGLAPIASARNLFESGGMRPAKRPKYVRLIEVQDLRLPKRRMLVLLYSTASTPVISLLGTVNLPYL